MKVFDSVFNLNSALVELNVPKLQAESDFSRRSLHQLYLKFKALTADFGLKKILEKGVFGNNEE